MFIQCITATLTCHIVKNVLYLWVRNNWFWMPPRLAGVNFIKYLNELKRNDNVINKYICTGCDIYIREERKNQIWHYKVRRHVSTNLHFLVVLKALLIRWSLMTASGLTPYLCKYHALNLLTYCDSLWFYKKYVIMRISCQIVFQRFYLE